MFNLLIIIVALYGLLTALLYYFQRHLIYHPVKATVSPDQYGLEGFSDYRATTADNQSVQLWHHPASAGFPTVVYFHGNAGHVGGRSTIYDALRKCGFGILALSYRGYGGSSGAPSESGLYADARAAIAFVSQKTQAPHGRIILFGESLGTGVAVQMALEYEVGCVVLEAPYVSVAARAAEMYPFVPVALLIKDKYHSIQKIAQVKAPLLLFHGERDNVIPVAHGKAVFAAATSPKQAFFFPDICHNDFDTNVISEHVLNFAIKHNLIKDKP